MQSPLTRQGVAPSTALSLLLGDVGRCALFEHLSPETLYSLGSTHGYFYQEIQRFWTNVYTYDRYFTPFISSGRLPDFWKRLLDANALVAGDVPLQFFARRGFENCHLEVCCRYTMAAGLLRFFEGIGYSGTVGKSSAYGEFVMEVHTLARVTEEGRERVVRIILTEGHPLQAVLAFGYSVRMNIITAHVAICLYPHETLYLKEAVVFDSDRRDSEEEKAAMSKYEELGWTVSFEPSVCSMFDERCGFVQNRSLADERTLIFPGPLGEDGWRDRSRVWVTAFKKLTVSSWSHSFVRNNRLRLVFDYEPHCTSAVGYCFSKATSMLRTHSNTALTPSRTPWVEDCVERGCSRGAIWEDVRAATTASGAHHRDVLDGVLARLVKSHFISRLPARGVTAYMLVGNLYPLFRCFRWHPWLVLVFPMDEGVISVKAVFIYESDEHGERASLRLRGFDTFTVEEFGFELIWANDGDHFDSLIAVSAPADASPAYSQLLSSEEDESLRRMIFGFDKLIREKVEGAVQRRQVEGCSLMTDCGTSWCGEGVDSVCRYLLDLYRVVSLDDVSMVVLSGRHPPGARGREVLTIVVDVPDEWLPPENSMLSFEPN
ncbi:hypothetical protein V5O48_011501, partial [Marasmius crinis-equi]